MSYSGFKEIEVRMEDRGVRVGEATAILEKFTVESISKFKCGEEMIALINRIPKLIDSDGKVRVVEVEWSDVEKDYRSQGIGLLMYEKLISESLSEYKNMPFLFIPNYCHNRSTSASALRVWKSLARKYDNEGDVLAIRDGSKR
tara:strand:+ start:1168 stop:1599 length:432 start_codon:yes stop_codon:yes gene_type:complete